MAVASSSGGISLYGAAGAEGQKPGTTSAILLELDDGVLQDVRKASQEKGRLQFVSGTTPKLQIGSRLIDLTLSPDDFRNELFASTSPAEFTFSSIVSHRAEIKTQKSRASEDVSGTDAAVQALQSSLASLKQEKEAKQASITNAVIEAPKNRYDAARKERLINKSTRPGLNGSRPATPPVGAIPSPQLGTGPTSVPASQEDAKLRAMRTPLIHLLAGEQSRIEEIASKTHIPQKELEMVLQRVGKQGDAGKWQLSDKAYRELDVWKFDYPSQVKRQAAIDNAVRAYDRMRVETSNNLWQMLLPKEERGKGKILSRLHLGGSHINRGLTPSYQPSPISRMDSVNDSRAASAANTPKLGPSTPRPGSSAGDVKKRLLAKDPQKARAAEEAKEKKRKEREAAASDRESGRPAKKQVTKKANVKSEEIVHSSDEESEGQPMKPRPKPADRIHSSEEKAKSTLKAKSKAVVSASSDSSDAVHKDKTDAKATATPKLVSKAAGAPASKPERPVTAGKSTPQTGNNLAAPNSQPRHQRSPSNPGSRPSVPSPLGAARPRVASDVSDKSALGVQSHGVRQGALTPNGLGITNGIKKQTDTAVSATSVATEKSLQRHKDLKEPDKQQKTTLNGSNPPNPAVNGVAHSKENGEKRKAEETLDQDRDSQTMAKRRKTKPVSTQFQKGQSDSSTAENGATHTSPDEPFDAVYNWDMADLTRDVKKLDAYWNAYSTEYDRQSALDAKGEKVNSEARRKMKIMHKTLEQLELLNGVNQILADLPFDAVYDWDIGDLSHDLKKLGTYYSVYSKEYDRQSAIEAKGEKVDSEARRRIIVMDKILIQLRPKLNAALKAVNQNLPADSFDAVYNWDIAELSRDAKKYGIYFNAYSKEHDRQTAVEAKGEKVHPEARRRIKMMEKVLKQLLQDYSDMTNEWNRTPESSVIDTITFNQGVKLAEKLFEYLPKYDKLHAAEEAAIARGEDVSLEDHMTVRVMHKRLVQMEKEIQAASEREFE